MIRALGIDLGNLTGWAVSDLPKSCMIQLVLGANEHPGARLARLNYDLNRIINMYQPNLIVTENTCFSGPRGGGTNSSLAELTGILKFAAFKYGIAVKTVAVGTLKKWTAGDGRASKEEMVAAVNQRWPEYGCITNHNVADAIACAQWGVIHGVC